MSAKFTDQDSGWADLMRLAKELEKLKKATVEVGILEDKGAQQHKSAELTVLAIAQVHEFGATIEVPEHPATIHREMVAQDIKTREWRGGKFAKARKSGYDTQVTVPAHTIEIPERSFIRATVDQRRKQIGDMGKKLMAQVVEGKLQAMQALRQFGEYVVGLIRQRISAGIAPPLAESTIRQRAGGGKGQGGDTPLFDTGQLIRSVSYRVVGVS